MKIVTQKQLSKHKVVIYTDNFFNYYTIEPPTIQVSLKDIAKTKIKIKELENELNKEKTILAALKTLERE
jgi:hypothetical protein